MRLHDVPRPFVVYFYPADDTPGCTTEACTFRDQYEEFTDAGATVVGISPDSQEKHAAFAAKHDLPFTLLSDSRHEARKAFGVPKLLGLLTGRVSFVIGRDGTVIHVFNSLRQASRHVEEALEAVRQEQARAPAA